MQQKHPLYDMLAPMIEKMGFEVVRILTIGVKNPTLQIMIERKDRTDIEHKECQDGKDKTNSGKSKRQPEQEVI